MQRIIDELISLKDEKYAQFQRKLIPTVRPESIIGVRTPELRRLAKEILKEDFCEEFLSELPHKYFEENQLHGFIISQMKDFDSVIFRLTQFLPYIDNWATCDQTSPKIFKKSAHTDRLLPYIRKWLDSERTYTVRFAIGMLMQHFLDERFKPEYIALATSVRSDEYYINMEIAWYMATALAKQWDAALPYLQNNAMDKWVHNKTIQKARESYRISDEKKEFLKKLKL